MRTILLPLLVLITLSAVGCGPGNPLGRVAVTGTVTLDGTPIDEGMIEFAPEAGVGSGAKIVAGQYSIDAEKGLPPGKYRVRVYAPLASSDNASETDGAPGGGLPGVERVSPRYNSQTTLTAEVPADAGPQTFDFDVTSK